MTDLSCNEFVELVTEYLDGTLDDDTLARFVDHLSVCDGCEQYLDQFRQDRDDAGRPAGRRAAGRGASGCWARSATARGSRDYGRPACGTGRAVSTWPVPRPW